MKFKCTGVMACALMVGPFAMANAAEVTWDINATFVNGGGVSGSFVIDSASREGVSENITITSPAASLPGAIFVGGIDSSAANTVGPASFFTSGPNSGGGGSELIVLLPSSAWYTSTVVGTEFTIAPGVGSCSASTGGLCDNYGGSYYGNFEDYVANVQSGQLTLVSVAPVPLGASGWLLLSALGGLGVFARKTSTEQRVIAPQNAESSTGG